MGFKWFKARMRMNRMPSHTSAIEGSYKIKKFDEASSDFISNNNQGNYDQTKVEPKLSVRAISMPILNNPMIIGNENDFREISELSKNERGYSSSTRNLDESEFAADMYKGLGAGEPVPFKNERLEKTSSEIVINRTPRPAPKMKNSDYRKKKAKAPAPKLNLNKSGASKSANGPEEYVMLENGRKTSQESDIDV